MNLKSIINQFIVLLLVSVSAYSQVTDSIFNNSCESEDIIILDEKIDVNIVGLKVEFMTANISINQTLIIKNESGLAYFSPYTLPKRLDELFIYHAPSIRNIEWSYDIKNIKHLRASHFRDTTQVIGINKIVTQKRVVNQTGFFGKVSVFEYQFEDLEVGDTIMLSIKYEISFLDNWLKLLSNRIFFHGKYPKKQMELNWSYHKDLNVDSLFVFVDLPETSFKENQINYRWKMKNLPGCLDEPNSRPYLSLPHFIFVPKSYDIEYTHFDSYKQEFIPIYYFGASKRQNELEVERWDNIIGNTSKNNLFYQRVADKIISLSENDSIGYAKMRYFQMFMVDSVNYDPSIDYYDQNINYIRQRAGVDLYEYKVYDNNIEKVYANIIPRLGLKLFTAYPIDKRMGIITSIYNPTVEENDLIYSILLENNSLACVIPKSDKNNYYFEELPFYYEGIPVLLMLYSDYANKVMYGGKRNFNTEFRQWGTPIGEAKDNYRKIQSNVKINLKDNTADFTSRLILSGQYSTLTRNVYSHGSIDSTINPAYFNPIWKISDKTILSDQLLEEQCVYYPFRSTFNIKYVDKHPLKFYDSSFMLYPGDWFQFIYDDKLIKQTRFLDYYPDFAGADKYAYMIEFDSPIKIVKSISNIDLKNDYCHLIFSIKQIDEKKILMVCDYSILTHKVDIESISDVVEINLALENIINSEIELKIFEGKE